MTCSLNVSQMCHKNQIKIKIRDRAADTGGTLDQLSRVLVHGSEQEYVYVYVCGMYECVWLCMYGIYVCVNIDS